MPTLRVAIAGHDNHVQIDVPPQASSQDLCRALYSSSAAHLSPNQHRLRFIVAGKSIPSSLANLEEAGVTEGAFVHCAVIPLDPLDETATPERNTFDPCHEDGMVTIDLGGSMSEHSIGDGSLYDWLWGFVLGALLGLIMVILARDRSIALSGKWKRGIGYGTLVNVLFGLFLLASDRMN